MHSAKNSLVAYTKQAGVKKVQLGLVTKRRSKLPVICVFPTDITMAGFEDSRPKTQAWNLAPEGAILFQFQKF